MVAAADATLASWTVVHVASDTFRVRPPYLLLLLQHAGSYTLGLAEMRHLDDMQIGKAMVFMGETAGVAWFAPSVNTRTEE